MRENRVIKICTDMGDGNRLAVGEVLLSGGGSLLGCLFSEKVIQELLCNDSGKFVLVAEEARPVSEVIKSDDIYGGKKEEAWNLAAVLVGPIVQEHGLKDRGMQHSILFSGFNESAVEQHIQLIRDLADWLLEE